MTLFEWLIGMIILAFAMDWNMKRHNLITFARMVEDRDAKIKNLEIELEEIRILLDMQYEQR